MNLFNVDLVCQKKTINHSKLGLFFLMWGLPLLLLAQDKSIYNIDKEGIAIQGYDPVSYFDASGPIEGIATYTSIYQGQKFLFANATNMKKFEANPAKYDPAYGGWCAYAMGVDGDKVKINPETYKILDSRLYLFYNAHFINTLPKWNKDEKKLKEKADDFWQKEFEK